MHVLRILPQAMASA